MTGYALWKRAARVQVLPVIILPVLLGASAAYAWNGAFNLLTFAITLIGAGAAHLFSNMINDLWDYRNGADMAAKETAAAISTNSGVLTGGMMTERKFAAWTWGLLALALVCGIVLSLFSGFLTLVFGALGALIAYFYVAPPLQFGYRGKGYGEIGILFAFGVLPVMGSFYVQTSQVDVKAFIVSLPLGLLTTLILFNHHFLHWRADEQAGKRTLVVVWGERRALRFSLGLFIVALLVMVAAVALGALPVYALVALIIGIPFLRVYVTLKAENPSIAYVPLMKASLQSAMLCGLILSVSLLIDGWL